MLCCQLPLSNYLDRSPIAQRLFDNLLRYADGYIPLQLKSALPTASDKATLLAATGLQSAVVTDLTAALNDPRASVIIMDASPVQLQSLLDANPARTSFHARGGWLVLWGLSADGLDAFNRLVGVPHIFRTFQDEQVNARPSQALLTGLSNSDLNFLIPREGVTFPAASAWQGAVDLEDIAPFCHIPGPEHFGDAKASPYFDHWPRHMLQGFIEPDHWRKSFLITNVQAGTPVAWDMQLPREADIDGCSLVVNTDYNRVTKMRLAFDGKDAETISLQPGKTMQHFSFTPRHVLNHVSVELLEWEHTAGKADNIGLNVLRLHQRRPADISARVQQLVDPGVLVRYPQGKGGILLVQLHPWSSAERDAQVADAAAQGGADASAHDKAAAEMRLWLGRDTDAQIKLLRQLLWNLGLE